MTLPGGSNPADVLFKLAKGRGLASPTFEQVASTWLNDVFASVMPKYHSIFLFFDVKYVNDPIQKLNVILSSVSGARRGTTSC